MTKRVIAAVALIAAALTVSCVTLHAVKKTGGALIGFLEEAQTQYKEGGDYGKPLDQAEQLWNDKRDLLGVLLKHSDTDEIEKYFYHFTLHSSDYQRKKIPEDYVKCAVVFHKTSIDMLRRWDMADAVHRDVIDRRFAEWIVTAVTQYLPQGTHVGFLDIYRYMKSISCDEYVHRFFTKYAKAHQLRKMEEAIRRKMNLALAVNACRSTR